MKIAILAGDGIGPEITAEAVKVLRAISANTAPHFEMTEAPVGGAGCRRRTATRCRRHTLEIGARRPTPSCSAPPASG